MHERLTTQYLKTWSLLIVAHCKSTHFNITGTVYFWESHRLSWQADRDWVIMVEGWVSPNQKTSLWPWWITCNRGNPHSPLPFLNLTVFVYKWASNMILLISLKGRETVMYTILRSPLKTKALIPSALRHADCQWLFPKFPSGNCAFHISMTHSSKSIRFTSHVWVFACICVCVAHVCLVSTEIRRECQIS